jgi:hypothetical protein
VEAQAEVERHHLHHQVLLILQVLEFQAAPNAAYAAGAILKAHAQMQLVEQAQTLPL